MKRFINICLNIRIAVAEIGGTVSLVLLMAFSAYLTWQGLVKLLNR
jgi:hypothetical protein